MQYNKYMDYKTLENFANSRKSKLIAFVWGLLEGLVFFIVPDVFLSFVALFAITGALWGLFWATIGSLVSACIIFVMAPVFGGSYISILHSIPGISTTMISKVEIAMQSGGVMSILAGPLSGIPYKIYTVIAVHEQVPFLQYLFWSIPARLERMLPVTLLALLLGYIFRKSVKKFSSRWILGLLICWILIYINYYRSL